MNTTGNIQNWLVAVDDSISSSWAFNYATALMDKQNGQLFILNVHYDPTSITGDYNAPNLAKELSEVEELKAKKVLVHYGLKAQQLGIRFTLMKAVFYHTGELICQTIKRYNIKHVIVGRRDTSDFKRWMTGSTSKYLLENVEDCNVTIVKTPIGATFDQTQIMAEKADLIHLIHQIEEVEGEIKPLSERIAEGVSDTKDRIAEGAYQTKDRIVEGVTATKDTIMAGVNPIKDRIVGSVTDTKDKLVEAGQVIKEESQRVMDEARIAKERVALEAKVAKDCIVDEAKHINMEAKVASDRTKYRLVDVFAFDESKQQQYVSAQQNVVVPQQHVVVPQQHVVVPQQHVVVPQQHVVVPQQHAVVTEQKVTVTAQPQVTAAGGVGHVHISATQHDPK